MDPIVESLREPRQLALAVVVIIRQPDGVKPSWALGIEQAQREKDSQ